MKDKTVNFKLICFKDTPYIERVKIAEELLIQNCEQDQRYDSIMSKFINEPNEVHLNEIRTYMVSVQGQLDYESTIKVIYGLVENEALSKKNALEILSSLPDSGTGSEFEVKEEASELLELIREGFATATSINDFFQSLNKTK